MVSISSSTKHINPSPFGGGARGGAFSSSAKHINPSPLGGGARGGAVLFFLLLFSLSSLAQPDGYRHVFTARIVRTDVPSLSAQSIDYATQTLRQGTLTKSGKQMLKAIGALPKQLKARGYSVSQQAAVADAYADVADTVSLTPDEQRLLRETDVKPWTNVYDIGNTLFSQGYTGDGWQLLRTVGRMAIASKELLGTDDRLSSLLTEEDLRTVADQYNEEMWRAAGPSPDSYAFPLESAVSHYRAIESAIDSALAANSGSNSAQEAVATTLTFPLSTDRMMRLISLIGFNDYSDERVNDLADFLPVGAILEIRAYTNGDKPVVKMVLNGTDKRPFGTPRQMPPYQQWRMFRSYMAKRIAANALHRDMRGMGDGRVFEPNGMVVWTPVVENGLLKGISGSHPTEDGGDYGQFALQLTIDGHTPQAQVAERHPDYVSIALDGGSARLDVTGMAHTGFFRLTTSRGSKVRLTVKPTITPRDTTVATAAGVAKDYYLQTDTAHNGIFGYTTVYGRTGQHGFRNCFGFEFASSPTAMTVSDSTAWAEFDTTDGGELLAKAANSFVDKAGLLYNFAQEIPHWEFNDTRMRCVGAWELRMRRKLFQQTLTPANKAAKLAELFSMSVLPRQISDKNGRYPSFADGSKIMTKSLGMFGNKPIFEKVYGDFPLGTGKAIWDYQWLTNDLRNVFAQSLVYRAEETGVTDDATRQVIDDARQAGIELKTQGLNH